MLVVVPAFNEEQAIAAVIEQIRLASAGHDVLVIDDGSTDATATIARDAGAWVISLPFNLGIGGAMQTGFMFARRHGYRCVAQVDGDGQHDPAALAALIAAVRADPGLDLVYGSRFLGSDPSYRLSTSRRIGIRMFAFTLTRLLGQPVTDPTSGFRLWTGRAIDFFASNYPHDYPEVESLLMLHAAGLRFRELAVPMRARTTGRSSITRGRSVYYMAKVYLALLAGAVRPSMHNRDRGLEPELSS